MTLSLCKLSLLFKVICTKNISRTRQEKIPYLQTYRHTYLSGTCLYSL